MTSPVALIFGVGSNIGANISRAFLAKGYRVAVAARSHKHGLPPNDFLQIGCDLSDSASVTKAFQTTIQELDHPSVVVYNGAAHIGSKTREHPLELSASDLKSTLEINLINVYVAAQQAVASFETLPKGASKTFIFTGNRLNIAPIQPLLSLGIGKASVAHMMAYLAQAYSSKGFKFYYADERTSDGAPVYNRIDGPAHAELYAQLAEQDSQGPWLATFVKGTGYKDFGELKA